MASRRYTNADLIPERPKFSATWAPPEAQTGGAIEAPGQPSVDQLLLAAKHSLAKADGLKASTYGANAQELDPQGPAIDRELERLAGLSSAKGAVASGLDAGATVGSFVPHPAVNIPSRLWLGARSAQSLGERGMAGVTEHPFLTAADAAGVAYGASGVSPALRALKSALTPAAEIAQGSPELVQGVVEMARDRLPGLMGKGMSKKKAMAAAGKQVGWPLGQSEATPISHLTQLHPSWPDPMPLNIQRPSSLQGLMDALGINAQQPPLAEVARRSAR